MAHLKTFVPYLLTSALVAAAAGPVHAAASAKEGAEVVTVFSLTDASGGRTMVATEGIDDLAEAALTEAASAGELENIGGTAGSTVRAATDNPEHLEDLEDVAILTPPMGTPEFFVAGVTWDEEGTLPEGATIAIRVMEDGQWLQWAELAVEDGGERGAGTGGTEPFIAGGAEAVQVQVSGEASTLPANIQLSLIPANPGEAEEVLSEPSEAPDVLPTEEPSAPEFEEAGFFSDGGVSVDSAAADQSWSATPSSGMTASPAGLSAAGQAAPPAAVAIAPTTRVSQPNIVSRRGWGADESKMFWSVKRASLKAAVVHHTAGSNNYTQAEAAGVVRGIYHYHAVNRGWGDIGYNFLVDKWGRVYEGRSGSLESPEGLMTIGAHASGFNTHTLGISAMGDYTQTPVPNAVMAAMADVIAWQFDRASIDATTRSGITAPGTAHTARGVNLPRIFGHRDVGNTACPGNDIASRLPSLISQVRAATGDVTGRGPGGSDSEGTNFLNNGWGTVADTVFRFGRLEGDVFVGDWNGDGVDTLAIRVGATFYARDSNTAGTATRVFAYGRPGDTVLVGDWDGDGVDTLAVRRGADYYFKNSVASGAADRVISYGRSGDAVVVGDWDENGTDTLAVRRGAQYFIKNSVTAGAADKVVIYGRSGDTVHVGDWDGNGSDTFAVRRGTTYYIKNRMSDGVADRTLIYGRPQDRVVVGDWDGNGTDSLGVRR